jgi:diguanylate cyclase (GGDEF)-like protein
LILTERKTLLKKWWFYILLYLPAALTVFAYAVPSGLNPTPFQLVQTKFGWVNITSFNVWDWFFFAYYIGFLVIGLILVLQWGIKSPEDKIKKQSRAIFLSFMAALIIASITDVLLSSLFIKLPQMAPIVLLIPLITIYRIIKKYSFIMAVPVGKKDNYLRIIISVILYIFFTFLQANLSTGNSLAEKNPVGPALLGIITQLQMMMSIYLVLKEEKPGFIAAVLLNAGSIYGSITTMLHTGSKIPLAGLMSYLGVIFIVVLIATYKKRNNDKIKLEKLLNQVSNLFLTTNEKNIDDKIIEAMQLCGNHFNLEFVYISFFSAETAPDNDYEWYSPETDISGRTYAKEKLKELISEGYSDKISAEGSLFMSDPKVSPENEPIRKLLDGMGLKSLVIRPMKDKNETIGILCLGSTRRILSWGEERQQTTNLIVHLITDIWTKMEAERELYYQANYDMLTGLPNRNTFFKQLSREISKAEQTGKLMGVIFIDIDRFKAVNDSVGHESGDSILIQIGRTLQDCIRPVDLLARFGGDEFLVMVPQMDTADHIRHIAERITDSFQKSFTIKDQEFHMSASTGIAVYPYDGTDPEILIKNADLAMYKSKEQGKNRYTFCTEDMKEETLRKIMLVENLHHAIERHELQLYYQPQICAESKKIIGVEALVRWFHPEFGIILPGVFIPLAEQFGLIDRIGDWVLVAACLQCRTYHLKGLPDVRVAVNVSITQLQNPGFADRVRQILEKTQLEPRYLELEITESLAVRESDYFIKALNSLKELGVFIAIDDFGTEYSSLSRLCIMPIDRIKLDMQFVRAIGRSEKEDAIIRGIIGLAHKLGLKVIAEGVESEVQLDFLAESSIDEIQGFFFYRPIPPEELESILSRETRQDISPA